MQNARYCESIFAYHRRPTHEVKVGDVGVGGSNPIRIQSMTIADTMDTEATVREVVQLAAAGCEIVRITAPSKKEAENLREIKKRLLRQGIRVPLVADIHYTPHAALIAADIVEKVRINPGNYADKKKFEMKEYTDTRYAAELERIYARFSPLVKKCKENGVAMRIGVNHGSLSDRIMNRYGDTPEGMVQSALEFLAICEDLHYHDIIISMKASNPQVMIHAYRLLAARMYESGRTYPFHLGVTEAGNGEDGRIKSAVGIGALLEDGIGDTIRVSLTEDAIHEIPVAKALVAKYNRRWPPHPVTSTISEEKFFAQFPPFQSYRYETDKVHIRGAPIGGGAPVRVVISTENLKQQGKGRQLPVIGQTSPDFGPELLFCANGENNLKKSGWLPTIQAEPKRGNILLVKMPVEKSRFIEFSQLLSDFKTAKKHGIPVWLNFHGFSPGRFSASVLKANLLNIVRASGEVEFSNFIFGLEMAAGVTGGLGNIRQAMALLAKMQFAAPVVLSYRVPAGQDWQLDAAATLGTLFCDGIGDGILIHGAVSEEEALRFSYILLQATRRRISKTEFISCPSCGRTLFNLQTTTERIKAKTGHLKGVKIAIMGCIVNGPGEMADADFGYVGAGPGKVNLFVGKDCVERNIPEAEADERLIDLIHRNGKWVEPENGQDREKEC